MKRPGKKAPATAPAAAGGKASAAVTAESVTRTWDVCTLLLQGLLTLVVLLALAVAYLLLTRFGLGSELAPSFKSSDFQAMAPLLPESALDSVISVPVPLGNIAVSAEGAVYFSFHPFYNRFNKLGVYVAKVKSPTEFVAFPSQAYQAKITSVLALRVDAQDRLWLLDHCEMGFLCEPTIVAFSVSSSAPSEGTLEPTPVVSYTFPRSVAPRGSFLNDFQVDPSGEFIYITDTSTINMQPCLVAYSVLAGTSHRILQGHASMLGGSYFLRFGGIVTSLLGVIGFNTAVDGLSLDRTGSYLYYSAVTSSDMWRIEVGALQHYCRAGTSLETLRRLDANLPSRVVKVSSGKPVSDGQSCDAEGNIWLTAFSENAIAVLIPRHAGVREDSVDSGGEAFALKKVVVSERLRWPDGLSFGPDGLYVTESALHLKLFGGGRLAAGQTFEEANGPYQIYRLSTDSLKAALGDGYVLPPAGH